MAKKKKQKKVSQFSDSFAFSKAEFYGKGRRDRQKRKKNGKNRKVYLPPHAEVIQLPENKPIDRLPISDDLIVSGSAIFNVSDKT